MQVLEIRPTIKWDKGKALEFLLESLGERAIFFLYAQQAGIISLGDQKIGLIIQF
jgi:hypothetical protein